MPIIPVLDLKKNMGKTKLLGRSFIPLWGLVSSDGHGQSMVWHVLMFTKITDIGSDSVKMFEFDVLCFFSRRKGQRFACCLYGIFNLMLKNWYKYTVNIRINSYWYNSICKSPISKSVTHCLPGDHSTNRNCGITLVYPISITGK